MLSVKGLTKTYAIRGKQKYDAVKQLNFELERGKFLAIVGRSGSGKSTLLGMLGGISQPSSGSVTINGVNQWQLGDEKHAEFRNTKIGFVFQFASLLPNLRAIDNVALPALLAGVLSSKEAYARARELLSRVGLAEFASSYPGQLSGGQQRRVSIARALVNSPQLLLADEPTADLDEETEEEILSLLVDIYQAYKITLVLVTHNPSIASRADRLLRMSGGALQLIEDRNENLPIKGELVDCSPTAELGKPPITAAPASGQNKNADTKGIEQIYAPAKNSTEENVELGAGIELVLGKFVLWLIPIVALVWAANFAVGLYESVQLESKQSAEQALEELAMTGLRADVKDVVYGPDKSYIVSIYLRNTLGPKPLYVLAPTLRAFVQVDSNWLEVEMRPEQANQQKVLKIEGTQIYRYVIRPDLPSFAQLIPYYMHVRISNDLLVSPSSQPKSDLIERSDNYYVYLKPHNADDKAILSKLKFPGDPPVWIPMPPH